MDITASAQHNKIIVFIGYRALFQIGIGIVLAQPLALHAMDLKVAVEPYLGYSQFSYSDSKTTDSKYGAVLGGKGGLALAKSLFLGLDYHLGGPYHLNNANHNEYLNRLWGVGLGYVGVRGLRGWFGYYYDAVIDDVEANVLYQGQGYKGSIGVEFQSKLSINLEYLYQTYDRVHALGTQYEMPNALTVSVIYLSLSSPLTLN